MVSPHALEEEASPSATKKDKVIPIVKKTRRQKIQRRVISFPLVPKTIPEGDEDDEDDEEDNLLSSQRTCLARSV